MRDSHANQLEQAERSWKALADRRPELAPAIALQRRLLRRTCDVCEAARGVERPGGASADRGEPLDPQIPVLLTATISLDSSVFRPFATGFCRDLAHGQAGAPAIRLAREIDEGRLDAGALVAASLGRRQAAIRAKAHHLGVSPDVLWLVGELTAGPVAHRMQDMLLGNGPRAQAAWSKGYCPACGSWPAFAELREDATRVARCSFCGMAWHAPAGCIYCGSAERALLLAAARPERGDRLVELCSTCGGYLKRVAVRAETPFLLLPVEDLSTSDLDEAASQKGYARPPMREFAVPTTLPCGTVSPS